MGRGLLIAATAGAFLALTPCAAATIVLDRTIADVAPGMTRAQAEAELGSPVVGWFRTGSGYRPDLDRAGVLRYRGGIALVWSTPARRMRDCAEPPRVQQRTKDAWAGYVRCALAAVPSSAPVASVVATTAAERTGSGLRVGSTLADLKRALPSSAVCLGSPQTAVCTTRGRTLQTRFVVTGGHVSAVELRSA